MIYTSMVTAATIISLVLSSAWFCAMVMFTREEIERGYKFSDCFWRRMDKIAWALAIVSLFFTNVWVYVKVMGVLYGEAI